MIESDIIREVAEWLGWEYLKDEPEFQSTILFAAYVRAELVRRGSIVDMRVDPRGCSFAFITLSGEAHAEHDIDDPTDPISEATAVIMCARDVARSHWLVFMKSATP